MSSPDMPLRTSALAALALSIPFATSVAADPDRVSILMGSEHVNATRSFEEVNPGVFLTWTEAIWDNRLDISVGAFRNSYGDGSVAVSLAYPLIRKEHWGIDVFSALAWYPGNGDQFQYAAGDIIPLAGLQGRAGPVFVQLLPGGGQSVDATLSYGLTFDLK